MKDTKELQGEDYLKKNLNLKQKNGNLIILSSVELPVDLHG